MNITQNKTRAKLLEILIGPPKLTQRAMAKKIGINHIRLNHFLKGRDHADRNTPNTTIGGEALEAVLRYLRTEHSWPPPFDAREALNKLKSKIPTTRRTIREDFIDKLGDGFIITAIDRRGIEAEDYDAVMLPYRPIGGLTQEDYDAFLPYLTPEDQEDFRLFLCRTTEE